jgi:cyclic beta-1,2-glucan synthetase
MDDLDRDDRAFLRRIARRTWYFFEVFAGPEDNWLPPDNYQFDPRPEIAHRTSPTNIGMLLLSMLSARDLGYLGLRDLAIRGRTVLDTMDRMERHRGHWLNWYDTQSLHPLEPRYVSTVDSGNLAISLVTLAEGYRELADGAIFPGALWSGLLMRSAFSPTRWRPVPARRATACGRRWTGSPRVLPSWQRHPVPSSAALNALRDGELAALKPLLLEALEISGAAPGSDLETTQVWLERSEHHLRIMCSEIEVLLPWLTLAVDAPPGSEALARRLTTRPRPAAAVAWRRTSRLRGQG